MVRMLSLPASHAKNATQGGAFTFQICFAGKSFSPEPFRLTKKLQNGLTVNLPFFSSFHNGVFLCSFRHVFTCKQLQKVFIFFHFPIIKVSAQLYVPASLINSFSVRFFNSDVLRASKCLNLGEQITEPAPLTKSSI